MPRWFIARASALLTPFAAHGYDRRHERRRWRRSLKAGGASNARNWAPSNRNMDEVAVEAYAQSRLVMGED